jgi:hypothetical protein
MHHDYHNYGLSGSWCGPWLIDAFTGDLSVFQVIDKPDYGNPAFDQVSFDPFAHGSGSVDKDGLIGVL